MLWSEKDLIILPITFVILLAITVGLYMWLRRKSAKIKMIPFYVIAAVIIVLEIIKQTHWIWEGREYSKFWIPLHTCSAFLLAVPFAVFLKQGRKVTNIFWAISVMMAFAIFVGLYIVAPEQIISISVLQSVSSLQADYLGYQTFLFHNLVILFLMLVVALKPYSPKGKDLFWAVVIYGAFMAVSAVMANAIQTNFAQFINFHVGALNDIRDRYGYFVFDLMLWVLYTFAAAVAALIVFWVNQFYRRLALRVRAGRKT